MADQDGVSGSEAANAARFSVLTQFTRDFSFENPNAPRTLAPQSQAPRINLQINVNARQLSPTDYEVTLLLEGGAGEGTDSLFKFELSYAGIFRLENIPADQVQPVVMIEGPRHPVPVRAPDRRRGGAQRRLSRRSMSIPSTSMAFTCSASPRRRRCRPAAPEVRRGARQAGGGRYLSQIAGAPKLSR